MKKTILITGATDGIGLETARALVSMGHHVLLHGRNAARLNGIEAELSALPGGGSVKSYLADLSSMQEVIALAESVTARHSQLDVLINNAGVLKTADPVTPGGLDVRFVVNTLAPYLLLQRLLPVIGKSGRVVNLSSAGQAPVDLDALAGKTRLTEDYVAYTQSKLALTMWSAALGQSHADDGPVIVAVNPGSLLGTKMVKEGFGTAGKDVQIGVDILCRAALSEEFETASGQYFDNDAGRFATPHPDAQDEQKCQALLNAMEAILRSSATGGL